MYDIRETASDFLSQIYNKGPMFTNLVEIHSQMNNKMKASVNKNKIL